LNALTGLIHKIEKEQSQKEELLGDMNNLLKQMLRSSKKNAST